ncbi:TM1812 family CRISPR-associated protein [Acidianus manzaensis]|uniref:CRISPR system endoribonuclease Csx1 CARF domain-containing protein n=1 Tax=Acidianus manzaensis TaxID=282676 RepID=A0A1W6JWB0_9CREN|nr:TM1812 family CRISPR-associated protein [Acidianus manzaensis]ARM74576.1 hypothetical protein B6F84_00055 [Acidianus manzaensis]
MEVLFYIAGDVSNYNVITYKYSNQSEKTFFAAHALYKIFKPEKVVALLPDSLISSGDKLDPGQLKDAYTQLIKERASKLNYNQEEIDAFLRNLEAYVIPNTGIGSAIKANGSNLEKSKDDKYARVPYSSNFSPVFIFNVIYSIFRKYRDDGYDIILDLTHGTNVLTSISLTVASMFNAKVFAAPVMGSPGQQQEVNIVELTGVIEAMKDSIMTEESIKKVDERYFRDYSDKLKEIRPDKMPEISDILGKIKSHDPGRIKNFLAELRNGFPVNAVKELKELEDEMTNFENRVMTLKDAYEKWYSYSKLSEFTSILLSNFYSALTVKSLISRIKASNDLDSLRNIIDLYAEVKYYDKFLSLAREYPIAYCLKINGGGKFEDTEDKTKESTLYGKCEERVNETITKKISDLIKYRNFIMHSGLSIDAKTQIDGNGNIKQSSQDVSLSNIEKSIEKIRKELNSIIQSMNG